MIYCKTCHYPLVRLETNRCPECGRAFDPGDEATFDNTPRHHRRWISGLCVLIAFYPTLVLVLFYGCWLVAAVSLGHRPIPSRDDPKYINVIVSAFYYAAGVGLLGTPFAMALNLIAMMVDSVERRWRLGRPSRSQVRVPLISCIGWLLFLLLIALDPGRVMYWFMD